MEKYGSPPPPVPRIQAPVAMSSRSISESVKGTIESSPALAGEGRVRVQRAACNTLTPPSPAQSAGERSLASGGLYSTQELIDVRPQTVRLCEQSAGGGFHPRRGRLSLARCFGHLANFLG